MTSSSSNDLNEKQTVSSVPVPRPTAVATTTGAPRPTSAAAASPRAQVAATGGGASGRLPTVARVSPRASSTLPSPSPHKNPAGIIGLVERVGSQLGASAGAPPAGLQHGNTDQLASGWFHVMLYGPADTRKTTTAHLFQGPENTRTIVTRRSEQMTPLGGRGFKFVVVHDADSLRYALLHPEAIWPEWANLPNRTLVIDDMSEGTTVLVDDYRFYFKDSTGETIAIKDPRQAYKKAGDDLHDLIKINMAKPQHLVLLTVERGYEIEGTTDYKIEPDVPNKIATLLKTEFEFVFYMTEGQSNMMYTTPKVVTRQSKEKNPVTKQLDTWREITFAKNKIPIHLVGKGVLRAEEPKDLAPIWERIKGALDGTFTGAGEIKKSAPSVAAPRR